jgi:triosephosphate isomerase
MTRKLYAVGNWKMYKTARETTDYLEALIPQIEGCHAHVYVAVPFTAIASAVSFAKQSSVVIGAQNMNDASEGAFTGEIAALMLKEAGASFVILGHSERRRFFHETDALIHRKLLRALADDLEPILCIGESRQERDEGKTEEVLQRQITSALENVPLEDVGRIIFAYEPVWAIGTKEPATADMAQTTHAFCRKTLADLVGKRRASALSILYGGSVSFGNVASLIAQPDIDGVLVGGASLDPNTFAAIAQRLVKASPRKKRSPSATTTRKRSL